MLFIEDLGIFFEYQTRPSIGFYYEEFLWKVVHKDGFPLPSSSCNFDRDENCSDEALATHYWRLRIFINQL